MLHILKCCRDDVFFYGFLYIFISLHISLQTKLSWVPIWIDWNPMITMNIGCSQIVSFVLHWKKIHKKKKTVWDDMRWVTACSLSGLMCPTLQFLTGLHSHKQVLMVLAGCVLLLQWKELNARCVCVCVIKTQSAHGSNWPDENSALFNMLDALVFLRLSSQTKYDARQSSIPDCNVGVYFHVCHSYLNISCQIPADRC